MPELPEVETVRRGLSRKLQGRVLVDIVQRRADLRFPLPDGFARRLKGRRVGTVGRRAKYLLLSLDDGNVLMIHLGMSGRIVIHEGAAPAPGPHDHVDFTTDDGCTIRYNDARRFGMMDLVAQAALDGHRLLRDLGPEPLGNRFNETVLAEALAGRRTPIKAALLDQKIVAGIGNIYACEALHRAGLSPRRSAHTVQGGRAARLAGAIREVLEAAIDAGGSSLRDFVQTDGELGYFQHSWRVYGREGEACELAGCGGVVRRITQSGRSTFYCAAHQK
jgi:formamidopyrimidine-DNA glycosylase